MLRARREKQLKINLIVNRIDRVMVRVLAACAVDWVQAPVESKPKTIAIDICSAKHAALRRSSKD